MFIKGNSKFELMEIFLKKPTQSFHLRGIARLVDISPKTAKKYLSELDESELLESERDGVYLKYEANRNQKFKDMKLYYTVRKIRESGLIEKLNMEFHFPLVILFGSSAKGEDIEKSDLDIFVMAESEKSIDLDDIEKKLDREVQLMFRTKKEVEEMKDKNPELLNNIMNGFVLSGNLEVF